MIGITGATGQLGTLVIDAAVSKVPPERLVALVRDPGKASGLAGRGLGVRHCDYDLPDTLAAAFEGIEKLLLISASEPGKRVRQHKAVIDAAVRAGVQLIAYTSLLHADRSPLGLAEEHRQTEAALREAGVPSVVLRNGWYTENYTGSIPVALEHGVILGCAGDAKISSAARADYAAAAAAVITSDGHAGRVYELAGDSAWTLPEFAAEVSRQSGKKVEYRNLSEEEYRAALVGAGLPEPVAAMIADSETGASKGGLFDDGGELRRLIGRPTTPMPESVRAALGG